MYKKAIIFGANGGIGQATVEQFLKAGYIVVPIHRKLIDFRDSSSYESVSNLLSSHHPDVVVNSVGHFENGNTESHNKTFDINLGSNWAIVQYYIENPSKKPVKIIMVGSSAYKSGRKAYILYAASKAALYNVWQGACDYFNNSNVTLGLINPVRTRTPMIDMTTPAFCLEPVDVAVEILSMASTQTNQLVDMKYPEEN
jgi:NAD(P)-dependent dehydrogenase (short-subunit alcohol dehydrogenase family)